MSHLPEDGGEEDSAVLEIEGDKLRKERRRYYIMLEEHRRKRRRRSIRCVRKNISI